MRHILQKSTWGEFFSCCSSNNKQPFYTSKLLMLPKDTILEVQVRPYSHLFNWKSKCSNQGPVPISLIQPFGQQGLQWLCLVNDQLILKASFKVFNWTKKATKIFLYFCPSFKRSLKSGRKEKKQARKGFWLQSALQGIGYFQNLRNFLSNCFFGILFGIFLEIFREFSWRIFWEDFLGGFFWEDYLEDFLGKFFGTKSLFTLELTCLSRFCFLLRFCLNGEGGGERRRNLDL